MSQKFKSYVSETQNILELTFPALLVGSMLGIIFGAASLYLALKVGMTVSASIPIAVVSITLLKAFSKLTGFRKTTILENNIMQTTGSAGESIAFGVAVTMPALLILGYDMDLIRIMWVAVLGGLLGVLMMIPLRHTLIVEEHGKLAYPEGTACAEVLIVGEKGGTSAATVFGGFFVGILYKLLNIGTKLWTDTVERALGFFRGATVSSEVSPELLGVGYIIGPRIASIMVAGGVLSSLVLIPMIYLFGSGLREPIFPAPKPIAELGTMEIWKYYVLYIGAGAVAAGGLISLMQSLPTIIRSAAAGLKGIKGSRTGTKTRTERDLSINFVLWGSLGLLGLIWLSPVLHINFVGALLIVLFGFLFVTVSSRITGQIGSSSNPISGMTVATLLVTSLVFLAMGWVEPHYRVTALSVAAVVCVASSNGGTTSQDLKTGFLVGATPRAQQIALLIGVITSGIVIGYTLQLLNEGSTVYTQKNLPSVRVESASLSETKVYKGQQYKVLRVTDANRNGNLASVAAGKYLVGSDGSFKYLVDPGINGTVSTRDDGTSVNKFVAPKARLMSMIIDGILSQKLPWGLVLLGVSIALVLELCAVSALPFAVGVYLPLSASMPIFIGGVLRWFVGRFSKKKESDTESDSSPGVLYSSGLIAGGAIGGIAIALLALKEEWGNALDLSKSFLAPLASHQGTALVMFGLLCYSLYRVGTGKKKSR